MKILVVWLGMIQNKQTPTPSGGDEHVLQMVKFWMKWREDVRLLTTNYGSRIARITHLRTRLYQLDENLNGLDRSDFGVAVRHVIRSLAITHKMNSLFNSWFPDVVCIASQSIPDIFVSYLLLRRFPSCNFVVYLHHLCPIPAVRMRYHSFLTSVLAWFSQVFPLWIIKKHDFHILTFPFLETELINRGIKSGRIKFTSNGIDPKLLKNTDTDFHKRTYDACMISRITPTKGIFDLVEIWRYVCRYRLNPKLLIMGTGEKKYVRKLSDKINKYGMQGNITLTGWVSDERKFHLLMSSKIFVFPSYEEGWGICIAEALSCGLPTVVYDLPAYMVFEDCIKRVAIGDKRRFGRAVLELLEDEKNYCEVSERSLKFSKRFSWESIAKKELQIIKSIPVKNQM
jgi:glycosyltransferase involved in cell wall biosynthesis